jgi:hypothetical protein
VLVEPAADTAPLQQVMQATGEGLIRMAVADKAGIELKGTPDQQFDIGNEVLGDTSPSKKDFGDVAVRAIERVDTDRRGTLVHDGVESLNHA